MFPLCVVIGLFYLMPFIMAASAIRLGGGTISLVGGLANGKALLVGVFALSTIFSPFSLGTFGVSLGNYVNAIFPSADVYVVAFIVLTAFYLINVSGIKVMSRVQNVLLPILVVGLLLYVFIGLFHIKQPITDISSPGFITNGGAGVFSAWMVLNTCCTSYIGTIFQGRNAANSRRDIPKAMLLTALTIFFLYLGCGIVTVGVLPTDQVGSTLATVAKVIFPNWLYILWILMVPCLLVMTTLNGLMSQFSMSLNQICLDGWFPTVLAKKNRRGAPWIILTFIYALCLLPVVLRFNVTMIIRNGQLFAFTGDMIVGILLFTFPKVFGEAWKKSKLHVPNPVYYLFCVTSIGVKIAAFYNNMLNMDTGLIAFTLGAVAAAIVWAVFRHRTGKAKLKISCWDGIHEKTDASLQETQPVSAATDPA